MKITSIIDDRRDIITAHNILLYASDISMYKKVLPLPTLIADYQEHIARKTVNYGVVRELIKKLIATRYYPLAYVITDDGEYLVRLSYMAEFLSNNNVREVISFRHNR